MNEIFHSQSISAYIYVCKTKTTTNMLGLLAGNSLH